MEMINFGECSRNSRSQSRILRRIEGYCKAFWPVCRPMASNYGYYSLALKIVCCSDFSSKPRSSWATSKQIIANLSFPFWNQSLSHPGYLQIFWKFKSKKYFRTSTVLFVCGQNDSLESSLESRSESSLKTIVPLRKLIRNRLAFDGGELLKLSSTNLVMLRLNGKNTEVTTKKTRSRLAESDLSNCQIKAKLKQSD